MSVCNWANKDQRKTVKWTAYLLSVSGLSSPLKSLTALIKHKQKSLPQIGYFSASATSCDGSGCTGGGICSGVLVSGISFELRYSVSTWEWKDIKFNTKHTLKIQMKIISTHWALPVNLSTTPMLQICNHQHRTQSQDQTVVIFSAEWNWCLFEFYS